MDYTKANEFFGDKVLRQIGTATAKEIRDAKALISAAKKAYKIVNRKVNEVTFIDTLLSCHFSYGIHDYTKYMGDISPVYCSLARALFMFENLESGIKEIRRIVDAAE